MPVIHHSGYDSSFIPHILKEIYIERLYDRFFIGHDKLVVVDIGANIGLTTEYFSKFSKKVYSVEPSKEHFANMKKNLKENGIKNVKPINVAVANKKGKFTLNHNNNKTMFSLSESVGTEGEEVDVVTIEDLFVDNKIDVCNFMKLDVEGVEYEILGGEPFKKIADRIDIIFGEIHAWANRNPGQIVQSLESVGFSVNFLPADASIFVANKT